jgi:hypothetical protein
MDPHVHLSKDQSLSNNQNMRHVLYREAIGSLMWAVVEMHPDISFSVSFFSQFMENLAKPHWQAIKRVFKYLKESKQL